MRDGVIAAQSCADSTRERGRRLATFLFTFSANVLLFLGHW